MLEFLTNPYFLGIAALCGIAGFILQVVKATNNSSLGSAGKTISLMLQTAIIITIIHIGIMTAINFNTERVHIAVLPFEFFSLLAIFMDKFGKFEKPVTKYRVYLLLWVIIFVTFSASLYQAFGYKQVWPGEPWYFKIYSLIAILSYPFCAAILVSKAK